MKADYELRARLAFPEDAIVDDGIAQVHGDLLWAYDELHEELVALRRLVAEIRSLADYSLQGHDAPEDTLLDILDRIEEVE